MTDDQSEATGRQDEKIDALQKWSKEICIWKMEVIRKLQRYDDYCDGRKELPEEIEEIQGWVKVADKDFESIHRRLKVVEKKEEESSFWVIRFIALGFLVSLVLIALNIYFQWVKS